MRYGVLVSINRGNRQCNVVKSYSITTSTTIVVAYARKSATPRCTHKIWMEREKAETQRALSLWKYVLCCLVANVTIDVLVVWLFFRRTIRPKKGNLVYQYTFYTSRYFHTRYVFSFQSVFFSSKIVYVVPVVSSTMNMHCTPAQWTWLCLRHKQCTVSLLLCRSFVTTELVTLFWQESVRTLVALGIDGSTPWGVKSRFGYKPLKF